MPMMDVSVALTNPYTLDFFMVKRRLETVSSSGYSTTSENVTDVVRGVVHPAGKQDLERLPEDQRQAKTIAVITRFALRGSSQQNGQNYQPDLVVWQGNNFVVVDIEDYSQYGPGFIRALCSLTDMTANAPETK